MKLFKVTVEYETVIRAGTAKEAEYLADGVIKEGNDHADAHATEITSLSDLPNGYMGDCRPWGDTDPMDRTIEEQLNGR